MTQHHLARPRIFGALLESLERDEQERHHPSQMSGAGAVVFLVLVLGPLMLWTLPLWLGAYYMLLVACICAFWWLDRGFVVRIGYGVSLFGSISLLAYIDQLRHPEMHVWEPIRIKWFAVLATASFVVAIARRIRRMRRDRSRLPNPRVNAD